LLVVAMSTTWHPQGWSRSKNRIKFKLRLKRTLEMLEITYISLVAITLAMLESYT